ncbi:MAG: acetyl-CoA carboxylase carboxyltransferase subunit beta [Candidatus Carbobacillus altaicus]|uniref:Acetyl-coenzyme A carboxylase carboxyl transferase subunit beta n=1 Tax=Candidatus Carbonibacillus altaicus TaxID=2163959 RepID=A0A2R6Y140_9BACL|nr:acetyl-CoA carboxylase carboxyltransferase subunit beta [Candidatus Carbobacillus altaicus]PTQ56352.1 MAG: Acetyl-coenzyme A carboxyl transferase beta chain [Candidatus Carbobacillus altaicus]
MNWREFFTKSKKRQYATLPASSSLSTHKAARSESDTVPDGLMEKCKKCGAILYKKELAQNLYVCPKCGYHFPMSAPERFRLTLDGGVYFEYDMDLVSTDPLSFPTYREKLEQTMENVGMTEAVLTGEGTIKGYPVVMAVMDSRFIMGSMGSVVGEKIARAIENARIKHYPLIIFSASGGARMQEGILSLMQMAKTSAALARFEASGGLFISVMTHPTTGGVSASFAMLGDYLFAEPGALIGFAGRRIIEQTIREALPEDFQTAEFLLRHGQLDRVVSRKEMRDVLGRLISIHQQRGWAHGDGAKL